MSTQFTNRQWRLPNNENKDKQSNYSFTDSGTVNISQPAEVGITSSYSFWMNRNSATANTGYFYNVVGTAGYGMFFLNSSKIYLRYGGASYIILSSTELTNAILQINVWQNWTITRKEVSATAQDIKLYVDGVKVVEVLNTTGVGTLGSSVKQVFGAGSIIKMDSFSVFDYVLSPSQITTLQGSSSTGIGNPMSLSPKPVAYYQLGDKSAFNGADYLVPNIAAEEADGDIATSFSPYALDFDAASSDYINCGDSDDFSFGNGSTDSPFSISAWVNWRSISANNPPFVSKWGSSLKEWLFILNNDGKIRFYLIGGGNVQKISATTLSSNTWYHVTATYDGSGGSTAYNGMNLYINGVKENATNAGAAYNAMTNTSQPVEISRYQANRYFDGKISNASIWNTELTQAQVSEIYNEGVPSNLNNHSAYSNLVSWWQLGSNSSFSTNWTVLDEKGSNNGTSSNMGEDAIVDGVGSYANGLSSGMGGDEVIGDAPYSTANALSVNMDVEDRVTDTPS